MYCTVVIAPPQPYKQTQICNTEPREKNSIKSNCLRSQLPPANGTGTNEMNAMVDVGKVAYWYCIVLLNDDDDVIPDPGVPDIHITSHHHARNQNKSSNAAWATG